MFLGLNQTNTSTSIPDITVASAKNHLPKLIHSSETDGVIPISRHGKVVAYIICEKDFRKLTNSSNDFSTKLKVFRDKNILTTENPWTNIRSKEKGREISL